MSAVKISAILFTIVYVLANASSGQATQPKVTEQCNNAQNNCQTVSNKCDNLTLQANANVQVAICVEINGLIKAIVVIVQALVKLQILGEDVVTIFGLVLVFIEVMLKIFLIIKVKITIGALLVGIVGILVSIKAYIKLIISLVVSASITVSLNIIPLCLQIVIQLGVNLFLGVGALLELCVRFSIGQSGITLIAVINACVSLTVILKGIFGICINIMDLLVASIKTSSLILGSVTSCSNQVQSCSSQLVNITTSLIVGTAINTSGVIDQTTGQLAALLTIVLGLVVIIKVVISLVIFLSVYGIVKIILNAILAIFLQIGETCQQCCKITTGDMSKPSMIMISIIAAVTGYVNLLAKN